MFVSMHLFFLYVDDRFLGKTCLDLRAFKLYLSGDVPVDVYAPEAQSKVLALALQRERNDVFTQPHKYCDA